MASATINDQLALYMTVNAGEASVSALIPRECYVVTGFSLGTSTTEQGDIKIDRIRAGSPDEPIIDGTLNFALVNLSGVTAVYSQPKSISGIGCPLLPGDLVRVTPSNPLASGEVLLLLSAPGATIPASSV